MSKDRVSRMCRGLDEHAEQFRTRRLAAAYPYLWLDAKHVKVRDRGRVVSKALVVAYAVSQAGHREVIGLDIGEVESEAFWTEWPQERDRPGARRALAALHRPLCRGAGYAEAGREVGSDHV